MSCPPFSQVWQLSKFISLKVLRQIFFNIPSDILLIQVTFLSDTDDCASEPCVETGICEDKVDGFICLCEPGFNGTLCDNNIDDCYSNPCIYGTCTDEVNGFTCSCLSGYEGDTCAVGTYFT